MSRVASEALVSHGLFVFSTHHYNFTQKPLDTPRAGRYPECGIFQYFTDGDEVLRESRVYFRRVQCRPFHISVPFAHWTGVPLVALSRIAERMPGFKELGSLLLVKAREAMRIPAEGKGTEFHPVLAYLRLHILTM